MSKLGADIIRDGPNSTLLKGIYALVQEDGELHLKQRWVEVHETAIVVFVKREEQPTCIYSLHQIEIFDEGHRDFSIEVRPLLLLPDSPPPTNLMISTGPFPAAASTTPAVAAIDDDPSAPHFEEAPSSSRSTSPTGTETGSLNFETDDDVRTSAVSSRFKREAPTVDLPPHMMMPASQGHVEPKPHHVHEVGAHHSNPSDEVATVRFRCCDRIECLEMLQFVEQAFHALRLRSVACQVSLSDFNQIMVSSNEYRLLCSERDRLRAANENLMERNDQLLAANGSLQKELSDSRDANSSLESRISDLLREMECLQNENSQLLREAEDGALLLREKFASSLAEAKRRLDEKSSEVQQLLAASRQAELDSAAAGKERDLLRQQLADAIQRLKKRPAPSLNGAGAIAGLDSFLNVRRDHLSWIRHHLCAVQIARFALSLKRASQILAHVPGSSQFAKEFSHDWPIASRLIELPAMIAEEDRMLETILCTYRGGATGKKALSSPHCAAPSCGGTPSEVHTCAALTLHCDEAATGEDQQVEAIVAAAPNRGDALFPMVDLVEMKEPGPLFVETNRMLPLESMEHHNHTTTASTTRSTTPTTTKVLEAPVNNRTRRCMDQCSIVPSLQRYCCGRLGQGPCHADYGHQPLLKGTTPRVVRANGIRVFLRGTSSRSGDSPNAKLQSTG